MFRNPLTDGIVVLVILLLFFGPKRLPELGKGIGEGIRSFKDGIGGGSSHDEDKRQLTQQTAEPSATTPESAPAPAREPADAAGSERSA
jgi:sec-independent protein translocase protein TatA